MEETASYRPGHGYGEVPDDCHTDYCPHAGDLVVRLAFPDEQPCHVRTVVVNKYRGILVSPDDEHPIIAWLTAKDCRLISRAGR